MSKGCVLSIKGVCKQYDIACGGEENKKEACPIWAEPLAKERLYSKSAEPEKSLSPKKESRVVEEKRSGRRKLSIEEAEKNNFRY